MKPDTTTQYDLLCLSHLRWEFVFQRPQHLMSRFARHRRVLFVEEPIFESADAMTLRVRTCPQTGVTVITPHLPEKFQTAHHAIVSQLLSDYLERQDVRDPIVWFYTPMALEYFPDSVCPALAVYDCMDELSLFKNAPAQLQKTNNAC